MLIIPSQPLYEQHPWFPLDWKQYKRYCANIGENISEKDLSNIQYEIAKQSWGIVNDKAMRFNFLLFNNMSKLNTDNFINDIQKIINKIELNLEDLPRDNKEQSLESIQPLLKNCVIEYQNIIKMIQGYTDDTSSIEKAISALNRNINILEQNLSSNQTLASLTFQDKKKEKSFMNSLSGISSALKGYELERKATKQIQSVLIDSMVQDSHKGTAIQTGNIKVFTAEGVSVDIKEDIAIFDKNLASLITVKLKNGKTCNLKELIEQIESGQKDLKITLENEEEYAKLQSAMLSAVSAKSGRTSTFSFHSGLTIDKLLSWQDKQDKYYWGLVHQTQLINSLSKESDQYSSARNLINYNLSRKVNYIIGKKNNLLLTRNGFETTIDYFRRLYDNSQYIKAIGVKLDGSGMSVYGPNI